MNQFCDMYVFIASLNYALNIFLEIFLVFEFSSFLFLYAAYSCKVWEKQPYKSYK